MVRSKTVIFIMVSIFLFYGSNAHALFGVKQKEPSKETAQKTEAPKDDRQDLLKEKEELAVTCEKLMKERDDLIQKCEVLTRENEALREDRSNFLARIKQLMDERNEGKIAAEAAKEIESLKRDKLALEKEIKDLKVFGSAIQQKPLKSEADMVPPKEDITKDSAISSTGAGKETPDIGISEEPAEERVRPAVRVAQPDVNTKKEVDSLQKEITKLNQFMARLTKENEALEASYDKAAMFKTDRDKAIADLKREKDESARIIKTKNALEKENVLIKEELNDYRKNYAEAVRKNKLFEHELKNMPKKFAEIARQNTILTKETSQMHYNLGVFYSKNKEYERAVKEFEKAVEINPNDAYSHFNIAYIYAEYMVNRYKAVEHFRHYLRLATREDKDTDWARKYILTWQAWEGKEPLR